MTGPSHTQRLPLAPQSRARWILATALASLLAGFWFYRHLQSPEAHSSTQNLGIPVRVALVQRGEMNITERAPGTVVANVSVQVMTQVVGMLLSADFEEGQIVKKGDLLFQIDPRPFEATVAQFRGQLAKDEATLAGVKTDLARYKSLEAENAIAKQLVDDQTAIVATDEGAVESDRGQLANAELNLGYTRITSPIDGQAGPILIQPGNYIGSTTVGGSISNNGSITSTTPLVTINQVSPIKISFFLPQSDLPLIKARQQTKGLVAKLDTHDTKHAPLTVPVYFVGNAVSNVTGTIELRARYNNLDSALVPGQLIDAAVELDSIPNATIVPHDALNKGPSGQYVLVVSKGNAEIRTVNVLYDDGKRAAVEGNVTSGDQVVIEGQLQVVPGGPVQIFARSSTSDPGVPPSDAALAAKGKK
jgi:membrane fusion protein, multidrug efflux system